MKRNMKKIISLILVLVMLVTMIPAGVFTVNAASEVLIGSVEDWNAKAGAIASGSTVKLTADIDFAGAEAAPLVPAEKGAVVLHFDGQGFAIKNATASAPLIVGDLTGSGAGKNPGEANEIEKPTYIKNVTFEKITLTAEGDAALVAGALSGDSMDFSFENIKVVKCNVTSTAGNAAAIAATHASGAKGSYNRSNVIVTNVTVDAKTTITAAINAAGVLAKATGATNANYSMTNVYVAASITSTYAFSAENAKEQYVASVGGILGYVAVGNAARTSWLSFDKCVVLASLTLQNATQASDGALGGLFGNFLGGGAKETAYKFPQVSVLGSVVDLKSFTKVSTYQAGFGTVNSSEGFVLVYQLSVVNNAPKYDLYDVYGKMYKGSKTDDALVKGVEKNLDVLLDDLVPKLL